MRVFQALSTKVCRHGCWCCQPEKTSSYYNLIISLGSKGSGYISLTNFFINLRWIGKKKISFSSYFLFLACLFLYYRFLLRRWMDCNSFRIILQVQKNLQIQIMIHIWYSAVKKKNGNSNMLLR